MDKYLFLSILLVFQASPILGQDITSHKNALLDSTKILSYDISAGYLLFYAYLGGAIEIANKKHRPSLRSVNRISLGILKEFESFGTRNGYGPFASVSHVALIGKKNKFFEGGIGLNTTYWRKGFSDGPYENSWKLNAGFNLGYRF